MRDSSSSIQSATPPRPSGPVFRSLTISVGCSWVDVETRAFATHVYLDLRPDARQQVDGRFILFRAFLPEAKPGPVRV